MDRQEHLEWAKARARRSIDAGDLPGAVASMISDLGKHDGFNAETTKTLGMMGLMAAMKGDARAVLLWVEGFN